MKEEKKRADEMSVAQLREVINTSLRTQKLVTPIFIGLLVVQGIVIIAIFTCPYLRGLPMSFGYMTSIMMPMILMVFISLCGLVYNHIATKRIQKGQKPLLSLDALDSLYSKKGLYSKKDQLFSEIKKLVKKIVKK